LALVERIGMNKTALLDSEIVGLCPSEGLLFCSHFIDFLLMAPIPPSRRRGYQFRAEELNDFLDIVESFLPISAQNWQAVADVHLENYCQEARTAESLRRKFQEIARRTGPTGDPN
jgi:hypothetical protein